MQSYLDDPKSTINFVLRPVPEFATEQQNENRVAQKYHEILECAEISTYYHIECVNARASGEDRNRRENPCGHFNYIYDASNGCVQSATVVWSLFRKKTERQTKAEKRETR